MCQSGYLDSTITTPAQYRLETVKPLLSQYKNGCSSANGDQVFGYIGSGIAGDVPVNAQSSIPFTQLIIRNTGNGTGYTSGDCNAVTFNSVHCETNLGPDRTICAGDSTLLNLL